MTITDNIQDLLEYLKAKSDGQAHVPGRETCKAWTEAVEQLQEDLDRSFSISERLQAENEIYRRILDKGITVNVYQDSKTTENQMVTEAVLQYANELWTCLLCDGQWQFTKAAIRHMHTNHGIEINRGDRIVESKDIEKPTQSDQDHANRHKPGKGTSYGAAA